jgi:hypothetical protein
MPKIYRFVGLIIFSLAVLTVYDVPCYSQEISGQKMFGSPKEAFDTLIGAIREDNESALNEIFGPDAGEIISSGDKTADKIGRAKFLNLFDERHQIVQEEDKAEIVIGNDEWPFPIPVVKENDQWFFDTQSGKEEILNRRIGRNELRTIQVLLAVVDAQREYAMKDRDDDGLLEYAEKFISTPGSKDGLYWESTQEEQQSPLGQLVAVAQKEAYVLKEPGEGPRPYYGYFYRMLKKQGPNAPGGAFDYLVNGSMVGGFAVIATPLEYGNSGVMTFVVNYDGIVYQKDLGPDTESIAENIGFYYIDESWQEAKSDIE